MIKLKKHQLKMTNPLDSIGLARNLGHKTMITLYKTNKKNLNPNSK
jgi:hypothetical protein